MRTLQLLLASSAAIADAASPPSGTTIATLSNVVGLLQFVVFGALLHVLSLGYGTGEYTIALLGNAVIRCSGEQVWTDPTWKSDGTGAMPIGNGDATSSVWVDESTGDLRLLVSKSDVFDENSQPVKTGVLRLSFDPPLWKPAAPAPPAKTKKIEGNLK